MALFKVLRGPSTNLSSQPFVDGYAYFTPDDGRFYIDVQSDTPPGYYISSGVVDGKNIYRIEIESGTMAELYTAMPSKTSDLDNDVPFAIANNNGYAIKSMAIPYGNVDDTSTATIYTATVPGITELKTGVIMMLHNGVITSASGFTVNINGLGAKPCYNNMTNATRDTTIFNIAYTMLFIYDETLNSGGGGWWIYRGYNSDNNTIGYTIRTNQMQLPVKTICYRYRLLFTSMDGQYYIPANTSTSTNATAKRTPTTEPFDPFGRIVYYNATAALSAGGKPTTGVQWQQYNFSLGYSFNTTGSALVLTVGKPVWLKCTPQSDGSVVIDQTVPYVQDLPDTEDGYVYIWLGVAYSVTNIELTLEHPVKCYKNGAIRDWPVTPKNTSDLVNDMNYITSGDLGEISYTPEGTISSADATTGANYTPKGSISTQSFFGSSGEVSVVGTTSGSVTVNAFTPTGTISSKFTGTQTTITFSVQSVSVPISSISYTPQGSISSVSNATSGNNYTPYGSVTLNGIPESISVTGTASGSVTIQSSATGTKNYTPGGTVSSSFNGTATTTILEGTINSVSILSHSYTPGGSISSSDATTGANYTPKGKINSNDTIALSVTGTTSGTVTSTFSGTGVQLIGTFTGTQGSVNVSGTTGSISTSVTTSTTDLSMTVSDEVLSFAWTNSAPVSTVTVAAEPALLSASGDFTPSGAVTIGVGSGTANYTPSGTITSVFNGEDITSSGTATASFTGSGAKFTFTGTQSTISHTVDGGTFTGSVTIVPAGSVTSTFTGTSTVLTAAFSGEPTTYTGTFPKSSISASFSGTAAKFSFTGSSTTLSPTAEGAAFSASGTYTPAGSITSTFYGTAGTPTATFGGEQITLTGSFTPTGTIQVATFTGSGTKLTFTGSTATLSFS